MIDPSGNESSEMYPCFEHHTLTDLLDKAVISWKYYTPSAGSIRAGPNAELAAPIAREQDGRRM